MNFWMVYLLAVIVVFLLVIIIQLSTINTKLDGEKLKPLTKKLHDAAGPLKAAVDKEKQ